MQQIRCSLIQIVIAILLITASCGDDLVVPTSGAAGTVVSIEGKVIATRAGEGPRPLNKDSVVYVNDSVATSEGASVMIELSHNNAVWSLDEDQERRINESIAWRASKQEKSAFAKKVDLGTSVAAADTTRTAGDTAGTAARVMPTVEDEALASADVAMPEPATGAPQTQVASATAGEEPGNKGRKTRRGRGGGGRGGGGRGESLEEFMPTTEARGGLSVAPPQPPGAPKTKDAAPPAEKSDTETSHTKKRNTAKAKKDLPPEAKTKAWIGRAAARCHNSTGGTGKMSYKLVISGGKVRRFIITSPKNLATFKACLEKKIRSSSVKGMVSVSGPLIFK